LANLNIDKQYSTDESLNPWWITTVIKITVLMAAYFIYYTWQLYASFYVFQPVCAKDINIII